MNERCPAGIETDVQRAFLNALQVARRAPSGNNVQPWRLLMLRPNEAEQLITAVSRTGSPDGLESDVAEIEQLRSPLSVLCLIDQRLARGSSLDYGMFLQNIRLSLAARGFNASVLHGWSDFSDIVGKSIPFPDHHRVLCALAITHADEDVVESASTSVEIRWLE